MMKSENKRLEDENDRQNKRLEILEKNVQQISSLATSVEKLAVNMENMLKEQEKQGNRLEMLEGRDGEKWRDVVKNVVFTAIGIIIAYLFMKAGIST
ncbi:MAG: hypothetical protein K2N80_16085 [Lachnospiraceae bacterium]|nr:hypothetical protein [Lachnospiraceae bacterium]